MDCNGGPHTALIIALHGGLYLANIMDRYAGPHTALTIDLHRGLYFAIIMDRDGGLYSALTTVVYWLSERNMCCIREPVEKIFKICQKIWKFAKFENVPNKFEHFPILFSQFPKIFNGKRAQKFGKYLKMCTNFFWKFCKKIS
jgi:hypothetical protein